MGTISRLLRFKLQNSDKNNSSLYVSGLLFLTQDWMDKINEKCIVSSFWGDKNADKSEKSSLLAHYDVKTFIKELAPSFYYIRQHLIQIIGYAGNKDDEDVQNFYGANDKALNQIVGSILTGLTKVIKCPDLKKTKELQLVMGYFVSEDIKHFSNNVALDKSFYSAFQLLLTFANTLDNIDLIVQIVDLLTHIPTYCARDKRQSLNNDLHECCKNVLTKSKQNENLWKSNIVTPLVKTLLNTSNEPLKTATELVKDIKRLLTADENQNDGDEIFDKSESLMYGNSLSKDTLHYYFKPIYIFLVQKLNKSSLKSEADV
eukprot:UN23745